MSGAVVQHTMSAVERRLLLAETQGVEPLLLLRTKTRVDTGRWLGASRLWLGVTPREIVLVAGAKRGYVERLALADVGEGWYCHTTGQLVIEPADRLRFSRLDLSPTDALSVLRCIESNRTSQGDRALAMEK